MPTPPWHACVRHVAAAPALLHAMTTAGLAAAVTTGAQSFCFDRRWRGVVWTLSWSLARRTWSPGPLSGGWYRCNAGYGAGHRSQPQVTVAALGYAAGRWRLRCHCRTQPGRQPAPTPIRLTLAAHTGHHNDGQRGTGSSQSSRLPTEAAAASYVAALPTSKVGGDNDVHVLPPRHSLQRRRIRPCSHTPPLPHPLQP